MILYFSILSRYFYDLFYVEGGKRVKEMEKTNGKKGGKGWKIIPELFLNYVWIIPSDGFIVYIEKLYSDQK